MKSMFAGVQHQLRRYQFNPKVVWVDRAIRRRDFFAGYTGTLPTYRVNARIAVNADPKYIFFRIPKAANSTIIATLRAGEAAAPSSWDEAEALKRSFQSPVDVPGIGSNLANYTKFVFCRNPVERAVSAYLDKLCRPENQQTLVRRLLRLDPNAELSFDHYLAFLEDHKGYALDGHFARQSDICFLDNSQLDFIGRFEHLDADLKTIYERIFGKPADITNWRPHKTQNDFTLTPMQKTRLEAIYRSDFEKFGY